MAQPEQGMQIDITVRKLTPEEEADEAKAAEEHLAEDMAKLREEFPEIDAELSGDEIVVHLEDGDHFLHPDFIMNVGGLQILQHLTS